MGQIWHCDSCEDDDNCMCACQCEGCKFANDLIARARNGESISPRLLDKLAVLNIDRVLAQEARKRGGTKEEMFEVLKEEARGIERFGITPEYQECHIENEETFDALIEALSAL